MTAVIAEAAPRTAAPYRLSFPRVVRSEWIKLLSLRSTWWSLAITVALSIGVSLMIAASLQSSRDTAADVGATFDFAAVMTIVTPMQFTMLVAGILGAIAITGEYSTGMIRSTLTADPRRGDVLGAKALVVGSVMAITTALTFAGAAVVTAPILGSGGIEWNDVSRSWVPLAAGVFAMATFTLIGLGFGFLIRNGAGAIAGAVGVLFVLPIVLSMFSIGGESWQWLVDAGQYLPMSAVQAATQPGGEDVLRGILTLAAWPAALLLASWAALRARDA